MFLPLFLAFLLSPARALSAETPLAVFAQEPNLPNGSKVINMSSGHSSISGRIHSNSDIDVSGTSNYFRDGVVQYVTGTHPAPNFPGKVTLDNSSVVLGVVESFPVSYTFSDFAPGSIEATSADAAGKYFHIVGDTHLTAFMANGELREGLYFVEGKVTISQGALHGKVTIVASKEIIISGTGENWQPYTRCLLALSDRTLNYGNSAINISGGSSQWTGVIFAPKGGVEISGGGNVVNGGALIGRGVKLSGPSLTLTGLMLGDCASAAVTNQPPVVNAGADQAITLPVSSVTLAGSVTDDGLPTGSTITTTWSLVNGPAQVSFGNASNINTSATLSVAGTYVLRLTASDSALTNSDDLVVVVNRENHPPAAYSQSVTNLEDTTLSITLQGSDPDDDTLSFVVVNPPSFGTLSGTAPNLQYTPREDYFGADQFDFKVRDGALESAVATVSITNLPVNDAPLAEAQTVSTLEDEPVTITLTGSDIEGDVLTFAIVSYPTNGVLSGASNVWTYTPAQGYYGADTFSFRVNDGQADSTAAEVSLSVVRVNHAPVVQVGADQIISLPRTNIAVTGIVSDDLFTPEVDTLWSKSSGPGEVSFDDTNALDTIARFSQPGLYVLRLRADDGLLSGYDEMTVIVNAPPTVDAGQAQLITLPASAALSATVSDDGFPTNSVLSFEWSKVSGPGAVLFSDPASTNTSASFSESGIYVLRLTANDGLVIGSGDVTITANSAPLVDAGSDQLITSLTTNLFGTVADDNLPEGILDIQWSQVSGPGTATFSDSAVPTNSVSFSERGVYRLRLTANDGAATTASEVTISIDAAPAVNAGADQAANYPATFTLAGVVNDDGLPANATISSFWEQVSGPGTASFADANALNTTVSFDEPGLYVVRLSASDGLLTGADELTLAANSPPIVSAGPNATIFITGNITLQGSVTDDGLPLGVPLDIRWDVVSGPGIVSLDAFNPTSVAAFSTPGTYVLRLTANDSLVSRSSEVTITVRPINHRPEVFAGTNQLVLFPQPVSLSGIVTDDGEPAGGILTSIWRKETGPGTVTFGNITNVETTVTFGDSGVYVLGLVGNDGELTATNYVTITANRAPIVNAGPDQITTISNIITLHGVVNDDGLPTGTTNIAWSLASGPGSVLFSAPTNAVTTARFTATGNYVLRLSATDGHAVGTDDVAITVRLSDQNLPPTVSAGADQYVALTNRTDMQGVVSDDGLPEGVALTIGWNKLSGPGNVVFASTNNPTTSATFSAAGVYVLRLTVSDTEFSVSDDVVIEIYPDNQPPVVDAGPDQSIVTGPATLSGIVSDDGRPTGQPLTHFWSTVSGPGTVQIANTNSVVTTVTFSEAGVYTFRLTASDSQFSDSDDVVVAVTGNQPPRVNAGPDQVLDLIVPGGAANSTVTYPPNPDAWRLESGQPGLSGLWGNIGSFVTVQRWSLSWSGKDIVLGGGFKFAGGVEVRNLARWNGCTYSALVDPRPSNPSNPGSPAIGYVSSGNTVAPVTSRGDEVFVGGGFLGTDLNRDGHADMLARWSGTGWEAWQPRIISISVSADVMITAPDGIYFGGMFRFQPGTNSIFADTPLPGVPVSFNVTKWNGTNWVAFGEGIRGINSGTNRDDANTAVVRALAVSTNGTIYAGGRFIMQTPSGFATNLAQWNGTNWAPVGVAFTSCASCTPEVKALAIAPNGDLYAGGDFTTAGSVTVNHIARWNGTNWSALKTGVSFAQVRAIAFRGNDLYAGGDFTGASGVTVDRIARWDGTNWFAMPGGGMNAPVNAFAVTPTGLYMGGEFFPSTGQQPANHIAKWGGRDLPTLEGPPPVTVSGAPATGATVPVTLTATHPCGSALTLTWNVDGGSAEKIEVLPATGLSSPRSATFTNLYTPGTHTLVATLDDGVSGLITYSTTVTVLTPATTTLNGSIFDDGLPNGTFAGLWDRLSGPASVTFSQPAVTNVQPITDASFTSIGTYVLRLTASDTEFSGSDTLTINVRSAGNPNLPPTVTAGADLFIAIDESAALNGVVLDDGLPIGSTLSTTWSQVSGPGTTLFNPPAANLASLSATFTAPGTYLLRITATDGDQTSSDDLTVTVSGITNAPPIVSAGPDQTIGLDDRVALAGSVEDDGRPFGTIDSSWSQASGPGVTLFRVQNGTTYAQFSDVGTYVLRLSANDGRLSAFDDVTINVLTNTPGPVVQILSPTDAATITSPTTVTGVVQSALLQSWTLQYRLKPADVLIDEGAETTETVWLTLATGTNEVNTAALATFDPTLLLNGIYELRLAAADQIGRHVATAPITLAVERNLKIGNFTVSFKDLTIPVAGIPIEVVRTYDSRDKRPGDFGTGWALSLKNIRLQKNRHLGRSWDHTSTGGFFPTYCLDSAQARIVTITFPDGRVQKFQAVPVNPNTDSNCQAFVPLTYPTMKFRPLGGNTFGTLTPLFEFGGETIVDDQLVFGSAVPGTGDFVSYERLLNPPPGAADNILFNPDLFEYASAEGYHYVISETNGLHSVTDPNGNKLTLTTNGITWTNIAGSTGVTVLFQRDASNRITNIVDAMGNGMRYLYDTNGNLQAFIDREGLTNSFSYDGKHNLLGIQDARGITPARNEYDDSGRLIKHIDAFGKEIVYTHDLNAHQEVTTDRLGNPTLSEYDERGNVITVIDPNGGITRSQYDANDNLLQQVDALGRTNRFTYDSANNRLTAVDALGNINRFTYGANRRVTSVTDARGNTVTNAFDAKGNLLWMRDPLGRITSFSYNENGLPATATNALGYVSRFAYDSRGQLTNEIDVLGHSVAVEHDTNGRLIRQSTTRTRLDNSVEAMVLRFEYDSLGRVTNSILPDGSFTQTLYNQIGKPSLAIDQLGQQTSFLYDELGRLSVTTYPDGSTQTSSYDDEGRTIATTNQLGRVTRYRYDALGRQIRTEFADGSTTTNYFDIAGQLIVSTDARGFNTFYGYDAVGRTIAVTNALGQVTHSLFDESGNLRNSIDALGRTNTFIYDALNRRVQTIFADGSSRQTGYDELGRRMSETDQSTNTTTFGYDPLGRVTSVTNALGYVTRYEYNEIGHPLRQIDANNHVTASDYDYFGRRTSRTLPGGQVEFYQYNIGGLLTNRIDFNGYATAFNYDTMNRLIAKIPDFRLGQPSIGFAYNQLGLRTNMTDAAGSTAYIYDIRNRLEEKIRTWSAHNFSSSLHYDYDSGGNLTNMISSNPNGAAVSYQFDPLGRLDFVEEEHGRSTYTYDDVGNLRSFTHPNGVSSLYQYDSLNRLTNLTTSKLLTPIASYAYTVSAAGQRMSALETVQTMTGAHTILRAYTYDVTYQLKSEQIQGLTASPASITYDYDPVGNRLSRTSFLPQISNASHTFDPNDRLNTDTYDANGNTIQGLLGGSYVADRYDFENRLTDRNNGQITVQYDGDGHRVAKTVGGVTTLYVVDGLNPTRYAQVIEELTTLPSGPVVTRVNVYGHAIISEEALVDNIWETHYYGDDGHGNVRFLTDGLAQTSDTYDYDAFGNLIAHTGSTANNYLFTGEQFDPDLGLYYLRARYQNADTGRFWTMDTFEEAVGGDPAKLHKYLYVHNNPVTRLDPSGHTWLTQTIVAQDMSMKARLGWSAFFGVIGGVVSALDTAIVSNFEAPKSQLATAFGKGFAAGFVGGFIGTYCPNAMAVVGTVAGGLAVGDSLYRAIDEGGTGNWGQVLFRAGTMGLGFAGVKAITARQLEAGMEESLTDFVVLRHGTTEEMAEILIPEGPNPDFVAPGDSSPTRGISFEPSDSRVKTTAVDYAVNRATSHPEEGEPVIVTIMIPRWLLRLARNHSEDGEIRFAPDAGLPELRQMWRGVVVRKPTKVNAPSGKSSNQD